MTNQNIKVGDKLLCKKYLNKYLIHNDLLTSFDFFIKGKYYSISEIIIDKDDYSYYVTNEINKPYPFFYEESYFCTYFYTKNEIRKMKLKNIYEESES